MTKPPDGEEPGAEEPAVLEDGLYVDGLALRPGGSQAKIIESLGTEDERYEAGSGIVNYVWNLGNGSFLTLGFTDAGSLWSGTIANLAESTYDESTFAVLNGQRVSADDTLASVAARFPSGEMGEVSSMEGFSFLDYTVRFGPEGSTQMLFSVDWGFEEYPADPMELPLGSITIEYW